MAGDISHVDILFLSVRESTCSLVPTLLHLAFGTQFFLSILSTFLLYFFTRWARPDLAPRSGGAVLEIEIPTGFYVRKQTLRITVKGDRLPARRFRFTRQTVLFYMDFVSVFIHKF